MKNRRNVFKWLNISCEIAQIAKSSQIFPREELSGSVFKLFWKTCRTIALYIRDSIGQAGIAKKLWKRKIFWWVFDSYHSKPLNGYPLWESRKNISYRKLILKQQYISFALSNPHPGTPRWRWHCKGVLGEFICNTSSSILANEYKHLKAQKLLS